MSAISESVKLGANNNGLSDLAKRASHAFSVWRARSKSRSTLARMDARLWRDIGMTPTEASQEINKPFWRE